MSRSRLIVSCILMVFALSLTGCGDTSPSATPGSSTDETQAGSAPESEGAVPQPDLSEATVAVREIAQEMYSGVEIESVTVVGLGQDSTGRWWVQAWTKPVGEGLESEQWFVTWDGHAWEYVDSGTGMERTDYPEVTWRDVP